MLRHRLLKRILPLLLSAAMAVQALPVTALAAKPGQPAETQDTAREDESAAAQTQSDAKTEETDRTEGSDKAPEETPHGETTSQETQTAAETSETTPETSSPARDGETEDGARQEETTQTQITQAEETQAETLETETSETAIEPEEETTLADEMQTEVQTLSLDTENNVRVTGSAAVWCKFTAQDAGEWEYFFMSKDFNPAYEVSLHRDMNDATPLDEKYSDLNYYTNTCKLNANDTLYVKIKVKDIYGGGYNNTASIYVTKTPRVKGTISAPTDKTASFSSRIECTFTREPGNNDSLSDLLDDKFVVLYSDKQDANFDAVEGIITYGYRNYEPIQGFTGNLMSYNNPGKNKVRPWCYIPGLETGKTYYYRIFARLPLIAGGSDYRRYWISCTDTKEFTTLPVPDTSKIKVEMPVTSEGHGRFSMEAKITNPDNALIEERGFEIKNDQSGTVRWAEEVSWKVDSEGSESTTEFEGYGYFMRTDESVTVTPYVKIQTGVDGDGTSIYDTRYGDSKTLRAKPALNGPFTAAALTSSARVSYDFDVQNTADSSFYVRYTLKKKMGDTTVYGDNKRIEPIKASTKFSGSFELLSLEPKTEYEVALSITAQERYSDGPNYPVLCEQTLTFTTGENRTYGAQEIPDPTLREHIIAALPESDNALSSANLEKITRLNISVKDLGSSTPAVKDLAGIKYLANLTEISIDGQDITDISPIAELKSLKSASFNYNQIDKIPDLSGMKSLKGMRLYGNCIPASEFATTKLPQSMQADNDALDNWENDKEGQKNTPELHVADTYYIIDGTAYIYAEIDGMRYNRDWTVKAVTGGKDYTMDKAGDYGYLLKSGELAEGEHEIQITAQEDHQGKKLEVNQKKIKLTKFEQFFEYQKYINDNISRIYFQVYVADTGFAPNEAYLVNPADNDSIAAMLNGRPSAYKTNVQEALPEDGTFVHGWPNDVFGGRECMGISGTLDFMPFKMEAASYDLLIKGTGNNVEKTYRFPSYAITNYTGGFVTYVGYTSEYDNSREYFYMYVYGEGLEYDKIKPQIKLEDGTVVAEYVSRIGDTYKLKKLDKFPKNEWLPYELRTDSGYSITYKPGIDRKIYTAEGNELLYISYNAKAKEYMMYTSAKVPDSTQMDILLTDTLNTWEAWDYERNEWKPDKLNVRARAQVTVNGASTKVDFRDDNGNQVLMPRNSNWQYAAKWQSDGDDSDYKHETSGILHSESGFCMSFGLASETKFKGVNEIPVEFYVSSYDGILSAGDKIKATLKNSALGTTQSVELTLKYDEQTRRMLCDGKFVSESGNNYPVGTYALSLAGANGDWSFGGWTIYVCGEGTFVQISQSSGTTFLNNQACVYVSISSADKGLTPGKFEVTFYDYKKNKIDARQIEKSESPDSGSFTYYYSGIYGSHRVVYVKVTYDGKLGVSLTDINKSYYAAQGISEDYGRLVTYNPGISFGIMTGVGYCSVTSYTDNYYVDILDDFDGTLIKSIKVNAKGTYYFTKSDLIGVVRKDSGLKKLYTLVARKGSVTYSTTRHCNIGCKDGLPVPEKPTGITLSRSTLTLGKGSTDVLTASLAPDNADGTVTFTSSAPDIVSVTQNDLAATLTAKAVGEATIKAAVTVDGKELSAECKVTVKLIYTDADKEKLIRDVGTLYAIFKPRANVYLKDVKLPEGWQWEDENIRLAASDTAVTREFAAVYHKQTEYEPLSAKLAVNVTEVAGVIIAGSDDVTQGEGPQEYKAELTLKGYRDIPKTYAWSAEGGDAKLSLPADKGTETISVQAKDGATGREKLSVKVTAGGNEFTDTRDITIYPAHIKDIRITDTAGKDKDALYLKSAEVTVQLKVSARKDGADLSPVSKGTFKWESSDPSVATVAENDNDGHATLTLKATGHTQITATADDTVKKSGTIQVYVVEDFNPELVDNGNISLNAYSDGALIPLYAQGGNNVTGMSVDNAKFGVAKTDIGYMLRVKPGEETNVGTSETMRFSADLEDGSTFSGTLIVTVDNKIPKVTFKAVEKANTFYKDAKAVYAVSADAKIVNVTTDGAMPENGYGVSKYENGELTLQYKNVPANKKAFVEVTLEGYKPFKQSFTVSSQSKKPSYSVEEMYLPTGNTTGAAMIMLDKTKTASFTENATSATVTKPSAATADISPDGILTMRNIPSGTKNYEVTLTNTAEWTGGITLRGKISTKAPDQLIISQSKVTLNNKYLDADIAIDARVKNSAEKLDDVEPKALGKYSPGLMFSFDKAKQQLTVKCPEKQGTYKYALTGYISSGKLKKTATLTVTVVDGKTGDKKKAAKLTLSGKGSINLVDRAGTSIVYTPKLSNISGTVTGVELGGNDYSLFTAMRTEDGKIVLRAVPGEEMQTKTPYKLTFKVTLDNGVEVTSDVIKVKPVNKPPKVKADLGRTTVYKVSKTEPSWNVAAGNCEIAELRLVPANANDTNTAKFNLKYAGKKAVLTLADKTIKPGKYNIKYEVILKDAATDAKAATLKMSVTVK